MRMLLVAESAENNSPESDLLIARWSGPSIQPEEIAIEAEMAKMLLRIRAEHMRWAYEQAVEKNKSGKTFAERLECGSSPSMWWTSLLYERHPKLSPELFVIYKLRCLEILLLEKKISFLELQGEDKKLKETLKNLCVSLGIAFSASGTSPLKEKKSFLKRVYEFLPAPLRAMVRYCHWLIAVRGKLPPMAAKMQKVYGEIFPTEKKPALIVSYFPNIDLRASASGRFRSHYWENLHDLLNEAAIKEKPHGPHFVHWLFIRFPSPDLSLSRCWDLCQLFTKEGKDGASFLYLEQVLNFWDLRVSLMRWCRLWLASLWEERAFAEKCHFQGSKLNFWPYVKWQWTESLRGWRCLERCLQNQAFKSFFKKAPDWRWVLFPLENCPWERMLTEAARDGNKKNLVFGAQHSIIRPTDFRYFDDPRTFSNAECAKFQPDIFGANGQSGDSQWAENGMPQERRRVLEALRYEYLAQSSLKEDSATEWVPPQPGEPLEPIGRRLLVLTSFFKDETEAHLELLHGSLAAGLLEEWQIVIKPHPYLAVEEWRSSLPANFQKKIEIIATPLSLALAEGGLVWTSNSTTAALEAALLGLPLMVMAPKGDFDLCPIQNIPGLARTSSLKDVKKYLEKMPVITVPKNYLDLEPGLKKWRQLLDLP